MLVYITRIKTKETNLMRNNDRVSIHDYKAFISNINQSYSINIIITKSYPASIKDTSTFCLCLLHTYLRCYPRHPRPLVMLLSRPWQSMQHWSIHFLDCFYRRLTKDDLTRQLRCVCVNQIFVRGACQNQYWPVCASQISTTPVKLVWTSQNSMGQSNIRTGRVSKSVRASQICMDQSDSLTCRDFEFIGIDIGIVRI